MTQTLYIDDMSVAELLTYVGHFCHEQNKYVKFGKNLYGAFKRLKRDGQLAAVSGRIEVQFKENPVPKELVEAIQKFMVKGRISNERIREIVGRIEKKAYQAKYTLDNDKVLRQEFRRFTDGIIKHVNKNWRRRGITIGYKPKARKRS